MLWQTNQSLPMPRTPTTMLPKISALAVAAACAAAAVPATAAADSLVYVKDGNVFLSAADGSAAKQVTSDGGYESPSQADDGTVVAARRTQENGRNPRRLHRMDRDGKLLNPPVETVDADNSFYIGPLQPKVSPDGRYVAYHYLYTGPIEEHTEPVLAWSHSDRDTVNGEIGANKGYMNASWTQDGRTLAFYAAERTFQVDVQSVDGPVSNWFGDADVKPLLLDGELSAQGDRLAALGNDTIRLYDVPGGPMNAPVFRCTISGFAGKASGPTWSPDGKTLAWGEDDGIHTMRLDDLGACGSAPRSLTVPGGASPDFGPAAGPGGAPQQTQQPAPVVAPAPAPAPRPAQAKGKGPKVTLAKVARSVRRAALRRGLPVRVTCATACTLNATLKVGRKTVAKGSAKGKARRAAVVRLKGRPKRGGRATLTVTARGAGGATTVVKRTLTLR